MFLPDQFFKVIKKIVNKVLSENETLSDSPDIVDKAANAYINKGDDKVEKEPDFNHLDVRCDRQALHHRDVHADQHQHDSDVYCNSGLKVEGFEVVGDMPDDIEEDGGDVDGGQDAQQTTTEYDDC